MPHSPLRTLRRLVATLVFLTALWVFVDFRDILPLRWLAGITSIQFFPTLLRALAGLGLAGLLVWVTLTLLAGRIYCSAICPLGILQDLVWRARRWIAPLRLKFAAGHPVIRYGVLVMTVGAALAGVWLIPSLLDPYSIFGRIAAGIFRPAAIALNNLLVPVAGAMGLHGLFRVPQPPLLTASSGVALFMLAGLVVMAALRGRLFCNTLCPVGGVLGLLSSRALFKLRIDKSVCEKCGDCLKACKAQCIDLKSQEIDFSRCVACYDCVAVCDQHGIRYGRPLSKKGESQAPDPVLRRGLTRLLGGALPLLLPAAALARRQEKEEDDDEDEKEEGGHQRRRQHRGEGHGQPGQPLMPPGAVTLERFLERCTACGLCVANCPTQVLQPSFLEYGWKGMLKPHLDLSMGYCNFDCTRCSSICPTGALAPLSRQEKQRTRIGKARFHKGHCIVHTDGTDCAACSEHCPTKAVDTVPYRGNLLLPKVDESLCIGCGACEFACPVRPVRAIRVSGVTLQTTLKPPPAPATTAPRPSAPADFPF